MSDTTPLVVMIASPLEPEYVAQIAGAFPGEIELIYPEEMMPATRYRGDHGHGDRGLTSEQQAEWHRLLSRAEVLFDFPEYETRPFGELCPRARWVQTSSAGVGPMVRDLGLQDADLLVTTASGLHAQPLAEFAFAAILYHSKELGRLQNEQLARSWQRFSGQELAGSTLAIIGPGRIGQEVVRLMQPFGMDIVANDPYLDPAIAAGLGVPLIGIEELFETSDVVSLHTPLNDETRGFIGASLLNRMKPTAYLLNLSRGPVTDRQALYDVLKNERIAGAGLDVFHDEPTQTGDPITLLPNVTLSGHMLGIDDKMWEGLANHLKSGIDAFRAGKRPKHVENLAGLPDDWLNG